MSQLRIASPAVMSISAMVHAAELSESFPCRGARTRKEEREMDFQRHAHRVRDEIVTKELQRDNILWPSMTRRGTIITHRNLVFFTGISVIPSWILYSFLLYFPFSIVTSNMNVCLYGFNGCNAGSTSRAVEFISLHVAIVNEVDPYCQS